MWKLDCKRMYVTYFGGDEYSGPDTDFMDVVLSFVPESNVSATTSKGSFWNVDDTGPCGPCSGIYYDLIGNRNPDTPVVLNDPTCPLLLNLVFIQGSRWCFETVAS